MTELQPRVVSTTVRPARVAVLIPATHPDWLPVILYVASELCTVWGGKHSVLIPTDGKQISPDFWAVLEAFDPDMIFAHDRDGWTQGWVDTALEEELKIRLCPLFWEKRVITYGSLSSALTPLAPVHDVWTETNTTSGWFNVPNIPEPIMRAWWIGRVGSLDRWNEGRAQLHGDLTAIEFSPAGKPTAWEYAMLSRFPVPGEHSRSLCSPFDRTMIGLQQRHYGVTPVVAVVVGDTLADYCLAYGLARLLPDAIWLPTPWLAPDRADFLANFGRNAEMLVRVQSWAHRFEFLSTSLTSSETAAAGRRLAAELIQRPKTHSPTRVADLLTRPCFVGAIEHTAVSSAQMFVRERMVGVIPKPSPAWYVASNKSRVFWMIEARVAGNDLPRRPQLLPAALERHRHEPNSMRISRLGFAYIAPSLIEYDGATTGARAQTALKAADTNAVFDHLADAAGYRHSVSDKGRFAVACVEKWGGLKAVCSFFNDEKQRGALTQFLKAGPRSARVRQEHHRWHQQRWCCSIAGLSSFLGADSTSDVVDDWVARSILHRGFSLKCSACGTSAWYGLERVAETFRCIACREVQAVNSNSWSPYREPEWFYRLDEIVYQGLLNNMMIPLVTLARLGDGSEPSFGFSPEREFSRGAGDEDKCEADILCIRDGLIIIGEAKKVGRLGDNEGAVRACIQKYQRLAKALTADVVVFATMANEWLSGQRDQIAASFPARRPTPLVLCKAELSGDFGSLHRAMRDAGLRVP